MNSDNQQTQGATSPDGFIRVSSPESTNTSSTSEQKESNDKFGIRQIPYVLQSMEQSFPFTAVLIGIIGYIVISSLGHMDSVAKYFGYILFLLLNFFVYRWLGANKIKIKINFKEINWFFIWGFCLLSIFVLIEHNIIIYVFNFFHSILTYKW
jgi:hypothetical protein